MKGILPAQPLAGAELLLDLPGLAVSVPSAEYLLALKVQAARIDIDQSDIRPLAGLVGVSTAEEILTIAERIVGPGRLKPSSHFLIQLMFSPPPDSSEFRNP